MSDHMFRVAKRNRYHSWYDENGDRDHEICHIHTNEHIPMKKESKVLRRLMSETGLTEDQLREHKKYRQMLSQAQKVPEYGWEQNRNKIAKKQLRHTIRQALHKFQTDSIWDLRVQGYVLYDLDPTNQRYKWTVADMEQRKLAIFNHNFRRSDKAFEPYQGK